jgi:ParB family transcriptional regulator, chromosome partitioning protein
MNNQRITLIPIQEIRIVNPRWRNRVKFQIVMTSISSVGLKKPITVHKRTLEDDGTRYDLVCGQGRLEAVRTLGDQMVPAIITDAPEDERYLMSLVENLARRQPRTTELLREVRRLRAQHYQPATIAQKLGMDKAYIYAVMSLLQQGEDELIAKVDAGQLPLDTAVIIARGKDADIQRALSEAYENGTLRGTKLREVQRLITRRKGEPAPQEPRQKLSGSDLVRAYEHHTQQQRALVRRSATITHRLAVLTSSLRRLWTDDHFCTLLRAEGLSMAPELLATRIAASE